MIKKIWLIAVLFPPGVLLFSFSEAKESKLFGHFETPLIDGSYSLRMAPLGPTDKGMIYSIGFTFSDGGQTDPTVLWYGKANALPVEVNSLAAIDLVVGQFADEWSISHAIDVECLLIRRGVAVTGRTGFTLDKIINPDVDKLILQLDKNGLSENTLLILNKLLSDSRKEICRNKNKWKRSWHEVDPLGAIERVVVRGSINPMKTNSILREAVYGAGTVDPNLLHKHLMFEPDRYDPLTDLLN